MSRPHNRASAIPPSFDIQRGGALLLLIAILLFASFVPSAFSFDQGPNNRNVTVDTTVNISGSAPVVLAVYTHTPVTLNAGSFTTVICNATIRDYNGFPDISNVNASIFAAPSTIISADNNNSKYTNGSCTRYEQDGIYANYSCTFPVNYYAINATWNCTVFVNDTFGLKSNNSGAILINGLYALNVTPLIDYGTMNAGEYSDNRTANVSNLGNLPINISVRGYGNSTNDGLSFYCQYGNLSVGAQHYAANSTAEYAQKQTLSGTATKIGGLVVPKATDANQSAATNTTYWELFIPANAVAQGRCNGSIVFQAEA
jgi:hypothetical protein